MPRSKPRLRLRWYEDLLLAWLARSPRIERIVVEQRVPPEADPYVRVTPEAVRRLEALYQDASEEA